MFGKPVWKIIPLEGHFRFCSPFLGLGIWILAIRILLMDSNKKRSMCPINSTIFWKSGSGSKMKPVLDTQPYFCTFSLCLILSLSVLLTRPTLQWKPWPRPHMKGCSAGLFTALIKLWTGPSARELPSLASWTLLALRYSRCGFLSSAVSYTKS